MTSPTRFRAVRPLLLLEPWISLLLIGIVASLFVRSLLAGPFGFSSPGLVDLWLVPVCAASIALLPTRVLSITPGALRLRPREIPGEDWRRWRRKIRWPEVAEVLLAEGDDRLTLIVGYRRPAVAGPLQAAIAEVPGADARTVAEVISRVAPAVPIREGTLTDLLAWTRLPYVTERRNRLTWWAVPPCLVMVPLVAVLPALLPGAYENTATSTLIWPWFVVVALMTARSTLSVSAAGLRLRWLRTTVVPWTAVVSVRIAASGDAGELIVGIGPGSLRYPSGHVLTCHVRGAALADLDAMLRAYAPPNALAASGG